MLNAGPSNRVAMTPRTTATLMLLPMHAHRFSRDMSRGHEKVPGKPDSASISSGSKSLTLVHGAQTVTHRRVSLKQT